MAKKATETTQIVQARPDIDKLIQGEQQGILTVLTGEKTGSVFAIDSAEKTIGRGRDTDIQITDAGLSRCHARVTQRQDGYFVEDMGSTNGTFCDGEPVLAPCELADGARIQIGESTVIRFSLQDRLEQEASKQMYEKTVRDPLTRLHNRRYLDERLISEFAFALRHKTSLTVLIMDVDFFKRVNDTLGHPAGDAVLKTLAAGLQRMVRAEDVLARFGGEEFIAVARGIDENGSAIFAERIRRSVEAMEIPWEGRRLKVTISIGMAHTVGNESASGPEALIAAADGALYQAKKNGRNRAEKA